MSSRKSPSGRSSSFPLDESSGCGDPTSVNLSEPGVISEPGNESLEAILEADSGRQPSSSRAREGFDTHTVVSQLRLGMVPHAGSSAI
jgi:hypothetical protein